MKRQIGIVGGGASGMMAAVIAAKNGAKVTLFDHGPRIGKKILSTGNGKCNFTNLNLSKDDYYGNHPSFVTSAFSYFDQYASISFFEDLGMVCTSVRGGYCYPFSMQASTVLNLFRMVLDALSVTVITDCEIKEISKSAKEGFALLTGKKEKYCFDCIILACGGKAFPVSGSDGSGYVFAKAFGHKVRSPLPALTYLTCKDKVLSAMAGVRCQAKLTLFADHEVIQKEEGELQLNKTNISGIPVFQLSHKAILAICDKKKVRVSVDFLKDYTQKETERELNRLSHLYPKASVEEAFAPLLHKKIMTALFSRASIKPSMLCEELSKKQILTLAQRMHDFVFFVDGHGDFSSAQATNGGVDTSLVDEHMMSKLVEGLYFAGEILDIDGRCGGYNLQWAWTSGYIAGLHSAIGEVKCYESHNVKLV